MASVQEPEIIVKLKPRQAWHQSSLTLVWTPYFRWEELWVASLAGDRVQRIGRTQSHILLPRSECWLSWQIELECYRQTVTRPRFLACTHSPEFMLALLTPLFFTRILSAWHQLNVHYLNPVVLISEKAHEADNLRCWSLCIWDISNTGKGFFILAHVKCYLQVFLWSKITQNRLSVKI